MRAMVVPNAVLLFYIVVVIYKREDLVVYMVAYLVLWVSWFGVYAYVMTRIWSTNSTPDHYNDAANAVGNRLLHLFGVMTGAKLNFDMYAATLTNRAQQGFWAYFAWVTIHFQNLFVLVAVVAILPAIVAAFLTSWSISHRMLQHVLS